MKRFLAILLLFCLAVTGVCAKDEIITTKIEVVVPVVKVAKFDNWGNYYTLDEVMAKSYFQYMARCAAMQYIIREYDDSIPDDILARIEAELCTNESWEAARYGIEKDYFTSTGFAGNPWKYLKGLVFPLILYLLFLYYICFNK